MKVINATRQMSAKDAASLLGTKPSEQTPLTINEPCITVVDSDTQQPIALLTKADPEHSRLLTAAALRHSDFYNGGVMRAAGMRSRSATFGFLAAAPQMSRPAPSAAAWAYQDEAGHRVISNYAAELNRVLVEKGPPHINERHATTKTRLHADWRLADTCWTSGIVNETTNLYYHYDKNNVDGTWSAMIVLRAGVRGGYLHVAEYDLTLPCGQGDVLYFPGMSLVHGVTPISKKMNSGYRFSIVYYSMRRFLDKPGGAGALQSSRERQSVLSETLIERQRSVGLMKQQSE